jgi:hypothetical protein
MTTRNIVWVTGDRLRVLALIGAVAVATGCNGPSRAASPLAPSHLAPPAVHSLTGTVFAAMDEGALPMEGARVEITNDRARFVATTDEDGRYGFADLEAGWWAIIVEKDGYRSRSAEIELTDSTNLDFLLEPDAN